ncbi:hypothetical protein [Aquabacterium sp.]|nr:hypothetical protein [Aquabacterium sp.]
MRPLILVGDAFVNAEVEFFEWPATSRKQVQAISEEIVSEIQR